MALPRPTPLTRARVPFWARPALCFGLGLALLGCGQRSDAALDPSLLHTVGRGELVITVRERGEVKAAQNTRVVSELEGRATLIHLVSEGTRVKAGDVVAQLDTSAIVERRATEEIQVAKAEAGLQQARKNAEIVDKELRAAESGRESQLEIARLRERKLLGQDRPADAQSEVQGSNRQVLEELEALVADALAGGHNSAAADGNGPALDAATAARALRAAQPVSEDLAARVLALFGGEASLDRQMGEMGNQVLTQLRQINLARADLEIATEKLRYSEKLAEEGFLTRSELNRDRIDFQRRLADMSLAWSNLELLVTYTLPESRIASAQAVADAELALESQRATSEARRVRERSELERAESELTIARDRLKRLEEQIQKGTLIAPGPGIVVYGRRDWDEPVTEGSEVRERQDVVLLPDVRTMVAELLVPEAQIDQIQVGQSARLVVDAFPGRDFRGAVESTSQLPDMQGSWRRDIKVYGVRIAIDGNFSDGPLKPGMNATVEIQVDTLSDVVLLPLAALERVEDQHYVWVVGPDGPEAREITVGRSNLTQAEVVSGLVPGERVHLVPPDGAQLPRKAPAAAITAPAGTAPAAE